MDLSGRCGTCAYWQPNRGDNGGTCHKNPPKEIAIPVPNKTMVPNGAQSQMNLMIQSVFPPVSQLEWCGAHSPRN